MNGNEENPTIYVIVNKSLEMSPGKVAAQVAHAVSGMMGLLSAEKSSQWTKTNPRTVIILECPDSSYMERFSEYLSTSNKGLKTYTYIDEGSDFHKTAMAIEPVNKFDKRTSLIFGQMNLFTYGEESPEELELAAEN